MHMTMNSDTKPFLMGGGNHIIIHFFIKTIKFIINIINELVIVHRVQLILSNMLKIYNILRLCYDSIFKSF